MNWYAFLSHHFWISVIGPSCAPRKKRPWLLDWSIDLRNLTLAVFDDLSRWESQILNEPFWGIYSTVDDTVHDDTVHDVDGSEIPRPTTFWMYKTL